MSSNKAVQMKQVLIKLKKDSLVKYLPTQYFASEIINLTNNGKSKEAIKLIDHSENVLAILSPEIDKPDKEWYQEILSDLRKSVLSAKDS